MLCFSHLCTLNGLCWGPSSSRYRNHIGHRPVSSGPSFRPLLVSVSMGPLLQPRKGQLSGQEGLPERSCPHHRWTGCAWMVGALGAASGCRAHCPSVSGSTEPPVQPRLGARPSVREASPGWPPALLLPEVRGHCRHQSGHIHSCVFLSIPELGPQVSSRVTSTPTTWARTLVAGASDCGAIARHHWGSEPGSQALRGGHGGRRDRQVSLLEEPSA